MRKKSISELIIIKQNFLQKIKSNEQAYKRNLDTIEVIVADNSDISFNIQKLLNKAKKISSTINELEFKTPI